ncbi:hypothetical protein O7626_28555 [Micromonospora sp. WMMD1102]|uniref:hypothetical protein n=1 Tax=Micromonospora sp. WMMD1102 TaxID=3016105 RepID=UPI002415520E|nr:hypothetical protein [Micromonospora sp. WMMD1102]MDG4789831.1 hypothetical protein [Micromonospora sp. WMMD1102]
MEMRLRVRVTARLAVLMLFGGALIGVGEPGLAAGGPAYNQKTIDITWPPPPDAKSCTIRSISLDKGTYRWQAFRRYINPYVSPAWTVPAQPPSWDIDLNGGEYYWEDCVSDGSAAHLDPNYWHGSILRLNGADAKMGYHWYVGPSGTYYTTWGSSLTRIR